MEDRKTEQYQALYQKANQIIGDLTPLKVDCGQLCDGACCRGDEQTGMLLFPYEESEFTVLETEQGRLAVCNGSCNREKRPLACRIFPFFPVVGKGGSVKAVIDPRAYSVCPIAVHSRQVLFDSRFVHAVNEVGKLLAKDPACRAFLEDISSEIHTLQGLYQKRK